tara:strand:+ start:6373 stop:7269 length:897 start_codon:yes stop_codon:yes gene_type:complete
MLPFFSVIIPTYNNTDTIHDTIQSVLNQTFKDFELIIIDDGSTDDTAKTILSFSDKRILYKKIKNYGGPSRPRNVGISLSKSNWVCFLDSDDIWKPNKLEICYKFATSETDLIYHDMIITGDYFLKIEKYIKARPLIKPVLKDLLLNGNCITNSSVVVRKSILNKVDNINESRAMIASEDFNTWLKISRISEKFVHIPLVLGEYLEHDNGISKRDFYNPFRESTLEFVEFLNNDEKKYFYSILDKMNIKNNIINGSITLFNLKFYKFILSKRFSFLVKFKCSVILLIVTKNRLINKYL